jgi:hypothetical protein
MTTLIIITIMTACSLLAPLIIFVLYATGRTQSNPNCNLYPEIALTEKEKLDKDGNPLPPIYQAKLLMSKQKEFDEILSECTKAGICPICSEKLIIGSYLFREMAKCPKGHFNHIIHCGDYGYKSSAGTE